MLRINVSGDFIPITSVTGDTSNLAATRGRSALPKADAPANIWVKLNCFWVARISGVKLSGVKPLKASFSATNTLATPLALVRDSAAYKL